MGARESGEEGEGIAVPRCFWREAVQREEQCECADGEDNQEWRTGQDRAAIRLLSAMVTQDNAASRAMAK